MESTTRVLKANQFHNRRLFHKQGHSLRDQGWIATHRDKTQLIFQNPKVATSSKICLLLVGQMRTYDDPIILESYKKYLGIYDKIDLYIFTWSDRGCSNRNGVPDDHQLQYTTIDENILYSHYSQFFSVEKIVVEKFDEFVEGLDPAMYKCYNTPYRNNAAGVATSVPIQYKYQQAVRYLEELNKHYDQVLVMRPDFKLVDYIPISNPVDNVIYFKHIDNKCMDHGWFGNYNSVIRHLNNIYDDYLENSRTIPSKRDKNRSNNRLLFEQCYRNNIKIDVFEGHLNAIVTYSKEVKEVKQEEPVGKSHFITYGNKRFLKSRQRLASEIEQLKLFDSVRIYTNLSMPLDFRKRNKNLLNCQKGGGYWLWKPFIIDQELNKMNMGDVLFYADAGCKTCPDPNLIDDYKSYIDLLKKDIDIVSFSNKFCEKTYTKSDTAKHILGSQDSKHMSTLQLKACLFGIKKTPAIVELVRKFLEISELHWTINDSESSIPNDESFIAHRHDQSIFSLLRKLYEPSRHLILEYDRNHNLIKDARIHG